MTGEGEIVWRHEVSSIMLGVKEHSRTQAYLHKSTSKKTYRRMIMPGQLVQFPQTRVLGTAKQGISLMGLVRLVSLSTTEVGPSRWVFGCVNMVCLRFITKDWQVLRSIVIVVFLVRGYVNEMFFVVVFLDAMENFKFSLISCRYLQLTRRESNTWRTADYFR